MMRHRRTGLKIYLKFGYLNVQVRYSNLSARLLTGDRQGQHDQGVLGAQQERAGGGGGQGGGEPGGPGDISTKLKGLSNEN
jgi:hypothetical protein